MEKRMYYNRTSCLADFLCASVWGRRVIVLGILGLGVAHPAGLRAATIAVDIETDNLDTNGDCSLREAVAAANSDASVDGCTAGAGADTIVVPAGTYVLSLGGASEDGNATGDLDIQSELIIGGAGAATTIIRGDGDRVFDIGEFATVEIHGIAVRDGRAPDGVGAGQRGEDGGGVRNMGHLTLRDCIIGSNRAGNGGEATTTAESGGSGGHGGGVFNGGNLDIIGCELSGNHAGNGGNSPSTAASRKGGGGDGGGIASSGVLTVEQSTVMNNIAGAGGGSGSIFGSAGDGGGISSQSTLIVEYSTISGNSAGDGSFPGRGGGIEKGGSGFFLLRGVLIIDNEIGRDLDSSSSIGMGGGIFSLNPGEILNSTLAGNVAGRGAGLYVFSGSSSVTIRISHSTIVDNLNLQLDNGAVYNGGSGAIVRVRGSILLGNIGRDCSPSIFSSGFNLFGSGGGCPNGDISDLAVAGTDLFASIVDPLSDNGGPTRTYALQPGSPAVDAGVCTDISGGIITTDQRNQARPPGTGCDIGAYEAPPPPAPAVLIVSGDELPGIECALGGQRIDAGLDNGDGGGTAGDGMLQPGEIDATTFECDDGSGAPILVDISAEPQGENCALGGTRIASGQDDNGDGALGQAEIDAESYVCTGASTGSLVQVVEVEPGDSSCEHGGQRIDIGLDNDRDGDLDAEEIQSTSYVCRPAAIETPQGSGGCNTGGRSSGPWLALLALMSLLTSRRSKSLPGSPSVR